MRYDPFNIPPNIRAAMERSPAIRSPLQPPNPAIGMQTIPPKENRFEEGQEAKLNALVVTELRRRGIAVVVARTDQKSTIAKGWPDLTCLCDGRGCCVELKSGNGKLSKAQQECHADLIRAGVPVTTAWNFSDAVQFVIQQLKP